MFEDLGDWELVAWSWYAGRQYAAAYEAVKRAVVESRTITALSLKANIEINWFEDLERAQATTDEFKPSELLAEMSAIGVAELAFKRRDPEQMLRILNALSGDFLDSNAFIGPKQYYTGWAHRLAGRTERAKIEWRKAVAVLEDERAAHPDRGRLFNLQAEIHALLGENEEAARLLAVSQRIQNEEPDAVGLDNYGVHLALRRHEEVLAWLTPFLHQESERFRFNTHADARFSPVWDGLRGDPRFEALLLETLPQGAKPFEEE